MSRAKKMSRMKMMEPLGTTWTIAEWRGKEWVDIDSFFGTFSAIERYLRDRIIADRVAWLRAKPEDGRCNSYIACIGSDNDSRLFCNFDQATEDRQRKVFGALHCVNERVRMRR